MPISSASHPTSTLFPPPPGRPSSAKAYLASVAERYRADAYNSLSIEGYQVDDALIERVASKGWNPERDEQDRRNRDALAALVMAAQIGYQ